MKKLLVLALLIVGITTIAQERKNKNQGDQMEQFTPEQHTQLMLKKMTLEVDLTEAQQKNISEFISNQVAKKEAHKAEMKANREKAVKPTKEERFTMQMQMLDEQIASKKRMEKILNAKQFEKWTSLKKERGENHHERRHEKHEKRQG